MISRRRAIHILGAAAGSALLPRGAAAASAAQWQRWDGEVLGASSKIELLGSDKKTSRALVDKCLSEARRLEGLFSLHTEYSDIARLNAQGFLDHPDADFLALLQISNNIHSQTVGAFDISVQPLWRVYGDHFLSNGRRKTSAIPKGPSRDKIESALRLVDQSAIKVAPDRIEFSRPGMAITLNGIAQGYITDRICDLLRNEGIDRVFVDMGEPRALGHNKSGEPWQVGLVNPRRIFDLAGLLELEDMALATSGAYGLEFDKSGRFHHILDPKSGLSTVKNLAVSVTARNAAMADGLSTAFSGMAVSEVRNVVASHADVGAIITALDGQQIKIGTLPKMLMQ